MPAATKKSATKKKSAVAGAPWYRQTAPVIAILLFALVGTVLLTLSFAAKGGGGGGKGPKGGGSVPASTVISTSTDLLALHTTLCPQVSRYTDCNTLKAYAQAYDASWTGYAQPADNYVEYNLKYTTRTSDQWAATIAHEVGGHVDTWNEIVARVGVTRAWTDYYDIDKFAQPFFQTKLGVAMDTGRAKELFTDCQGAVRNGYLGGYLQGYYGKYTLADQQAVCNGYRTIFDQAIAS